MSNVITSEFTVLGSRYHRGADGKITVYLQVQKNNSTPVGYVKYVGSQPPLPGTLIRAKGSVVETNQGPVINVASENHVTVLSAQQSSVLFQTLKTLLTRMKIGFNESDLHDQCYSPTNHLVQMDASRLEVILGNSGVKDAHLIIQEREETFAGALTKNFFQSIEAIKHPFDVDAKRDLPFVKNTWPADILRPCVNKMLDVPLGRAGHPAMPSGKPMYLGNIVKFDGIDNFFRALSIYSLDPTMFASWMKDPARPSMITQTYLDEKQKKGTQIFTAGDLKQLERLGLNAAAKIAARVGNMVQIPNEKNELLLIPTGTYQSSTLLSNLGKLNKQKTALNVAVNDTGLDPFQKKSLHSYIEGAPLTLISGPPGSGKSTLISSMIEHTLRAGKKVVVVTPTGKSSSRLNVGFEKQFKNVVSGTIHSLFYGTTANRKVNKGAPHLNVKTIRDALDSNATNMFPVAVDKVMRQTSYTQNKNVVLKPEHQIYHDLVTPEILRDAVVFVDESTQVTADLAALLLEMNPARLVMTGDLSQLKPVGAGKPFHDFIQLCQDGFYDDLVNFSELQIDHRATKELSDFTRKLREGQIPLDYVDEFTGDPEATAKDLASREAAVLELKTLDDTINVVESLVRKTVLEQQRNFTVCDATGQSSGLSITLPAKLSPELSVQHLVSPSLMVMAHSNAEVSSLNQTIANVLRPLMASGTAMSEIPAFSQMALSDIQLGDPVLQTENTKARILYTTPQGHHISSSSMNGETFVLLATNVWLPLPQGNSAADQELQKWWASVGLTAEMQALKTDVQKITDPQQHLDLFRKLQAAAHTNTDALALIKASLSEALLVDQSKLSANSSVVLAEKDIKRFVIPPALPEKLDDNEKSYYASLINHVWKIDAANHNSKPGRTGIIEVPEYKIQYEKLMDGIQTLSLGNAYTVHKAQGSQAETVISVVAPPLQADESSSHEASFYTATTRAERHSYSLIHSTTAAQLNSLWLTARELEKEKLSPVQLIRRGVIPGHAQTMEMVSVVPPQKLREELTPGAVSADNSADRYRSKMLFSSHNLPPTLSTDYLPVIERQVQSRHGTLDLKQSKSLVPGLGDLVEKQIPNLAVKNEMTWKKVTDWSLDSPEAKEIQEELGDMLSDFKFG